MVRAVGHSRTLSPWDSSADGIALCETSDPPLVSATGGKRGMSRQRVVSVAHMVVVCLVLKFQRQIASGTNDGRAERRLRFGSQ